MRPPGGGKQALGTVAGGQPCSKACTGSERVWRSGTKTSFQFRIFLCRESMAILKQKRMEGYNNNNSHSLKEHSEGDAERGCCCR